MRTVYPVDDARSELLYL